ncbi:MAG: winged helix-turn-helix domain-containing protein, partial [Propionicimonas sp.]
MELFQSGVGSAAVSRLQALLPLPEDVAAYAGLAHALRGLVVEGHLTVGSRLPSERTLALALGLSRTTITRAYSELVATGWASARQGSGTVVRMPGKTRIPS